ncbi:MAG: class I SAM-dependent methyltransferase [Bacteroidales bacterium]|nr:class I SAM-dependent methyltransferase [Bacteroidales bacterium]
MHKHAGGYIKISRRGKPKVIINKRLGSFIVDNKIVKALQIFLNQYELDEKSSILDVGAGTKPYYSLYSKYFRNCYSTDVETSPHSIDSIDFFCSAHDIPVNDNSADLVLCTEVLEHVKNPQDVLNEFRRILKTGGKLFLTTPFVQYIHELPNDFFRYTPFALKEMAEKSGLQIEYFYDKGGIFSIVFLLSTAYYLKFWNRISKILKVQIIYSVFNPFIFIPVVIPGLIYLKLSGNPHVQNITTGAKRFGINRIITPGYITVISKP